MTEVRVEVEGHTLKLSNLDKVLYPRTGTTKGEVLHYYATVAPVLLPHLADRAVTRIRWPHGVAAASFFALRFKRPQVTRRMDRGSDYHMPYPQPNFRKACNHNLGGLGQLLPHTLR